MSRIFPALITILALSTTPALADDAGDVRATIERHYAAIKAGSIEVINSHHLEDFTMFLTKGSLLWEPDWAAAAERMGATVKFTPSNKRMTGFNAQIYGNVAIATFYLVDNQTHGDKITDTTDRVSAVWVKTGGEWKEAHHHESPLRSGRHH